MKLEGADSSYISPKTTSIESFGKHYLVRSLANPRVRRHYTVASCMKQEVYQGYINAIESFKNGGRHGSINDGIFVNNLNDRSDEIVIAIKNYRIAGGFSNLIHSATKEDVFQVKTLLGKGLDLQRDGTHVAFVGGTGVLVFVDLIALLIKVNLGLVDKDSIPLFSKGSSFKFVLYATFSST